MEKTEKAEVNPRADVRKKYSDAEAQAQAKYNEAVSEALKLVEEANESSDVKTTKAGRTLTRELDEAQQTMLKEMAKLDAKAEKTVPFVGDTDEVPVRDANKEEIAESLRIPEDSAVIRLLNDATALIREEGTTLYIQRSPNGYFHSFVEPVEGVYLPKGVLAEETDGVLVLTQYIDGEAQPSPMRYTQLTTAEILATQIKNYLN